MQQPTSQLQQMQEQMNSMSDSRDFQDVGSNYSGRLSHVSSQLAMIPTSRSLLSRDKRLPLDTWNQSGLQETFLGNQLSTFDSHRDHPQRIQSDNVQRNREAVLEARRTKTIHTSEDRKNQGTIPMPTFATKSFGADQQRLQISDLHFDKFLTPATLACWKIRFKTEECTCSQFPTEAMQWIKEVELVDSVDELRSSSSTRGISMPNFEVLDARIASALNNIIQNTRFKKKVSLEEQKAQKEDRFLHDLRLLLSYWH